MSDSISAPPKNVPTVLGGIEEGGFDPSDNANHEPGPEENWQESSLFCFFDSRTGVAGYYRIGIHPNTGASQVYNWTTLNGQTVDRRMHVELPLPDGDTTDTEVGGLSIRTTDPLNAWRLESTGERSTTRCSWESYTGPLTYSLDAGGGKLATGHYNSLGRAKGSVEFDGEVIEFNAVGYMDHSWGPRDANTILSHQWMLAMFDDEFLITAMPVALPQANVLFGYVYDKGQIKHLTDVDLALSVSFDNHIPRSAEARVRDAGERGYVVSGEAYGEASLQPFGHGHFVTHRAARFACGGRVGQGLLEMSGPRVIPPQHLATLDLDPAHRWVAGNGQGP